MTRETFSWLINIFILILISIAFGSFLAMHLSAQERERGFNAQDRVQQYINEDLQKGIDNTAMDVKDLKSQVLALQSEIDLSRGLGAGISAAVMFLQVLGLLKRRKEI